MPLLQYYKPSEVREAAAYVWNQLNTAGKEEMANALEVTTTNLYSAVKLKPKEQSNPETLRGIDTCVRILREHGTPIGLIPMYPVEVEKTVSAQAADMPKL